jgi:hypothetical protein
LISLRSQLVDAIQRIASLKGIVSHQGQDIDSVEETIANPRNDISEYEAALEDVHQQIADAREAELAQKKVNHLFERFSVAHSKKFETPRSELQSSRKRTRFGKPEKKLARLSSIEW